MLNRIKIVGLGGLRRCGAFAALRFVQRRRALVLAYHGVLTTTRPAASYLDYNFIPAEMFEAQVRHLRTHFRPISLSQFVEGYERGTLLPERSVLITFDDGFANNYRVAFPILKAHDVPFTVFLTTGMIDRPDAQLWSERVSRAVYLSPLSRVDLHFGEDHCTFALTNAATREQASRALVALLKRLNPADRERRLIAIERAFGRPKLSEAERERYEFLTWTEIRQMAAAGVEFGSHSVTHPILSTLDDASLERELVDSKREIESRIGAACKVFAYPNGGQGDYGPREQRALRDAGYRCAFALLGGLVGPGDDPFALERVNVGRDFNGALFEAASTGLLGTARKVRALAGGSRADTPDPAAPSLDYVH
jgi:peptidoglycan/xylan/chitin deacetylase (PgdA/CDA1 family)